MGVELSRPLTVTCLSTLMECVLPRDLGELAVGDLNEEFALREQTTSRARASAWFAMQAAASVPRLLLLSVRRPSWLKSLGVAVAAYVALEFVEPYMHRFVSLFAEPGFNAALIIDLGVGFAACACGGFLSTWAHRGSAALYSVISTGFLAWAMRNANPDLPSWFLAAFLVVALAAPITGGAAFIACANRLKKRNR
jgi:hypothetical protein